MSILKLLCALAFLICGIIFESESVEIINENQVINLTDPGIIDNIENLEDQIKKMQEKIEILEHKNSILESRFNFLRKINNQDYEDNLTDGDNLNKNVNFRNQNNTGTPEGFYSQINFNNKDNPLYGIYSFGDQDLNNIKMENFYEKISYKLFRTAATKGHTGDLLNEMNNFLDVNPKSIFAGDISHWIADSYMLNSSLIKAIEYYLMAYKLTTNTKISPYIAVKMSVALIQNGDYLAACDTFKKLLKKHSKDMNNNLFNYTMNQVKYLKSTGSFCLDVD